jgi:hypothetical protein
MGIPQLIERPVRVEIARIAPARQIPRPGDLARSDAPYLEE